MIAQTPALDACLPNRSQPIAYPLLARHARVEGSVQARFTINAEGRAESASYEASHSMLRGTVKEALERASFPAPCRGREVSFAFEFVLRKETSSEANQVTEFIPPNIIRMTVNQPVMSVLGARDSPVGQADACLPDTLEIAYPYIARAAIVEGAVEVGFLIDSNRRALRQTYDGHDMLREAVGRVMERATFPQQCAGRVLTLVFQFVLRPKSSEKPNQTVDFVPPNIVLVVANRHVQPAQP
jgi:TonB family protein